MLIIDMIISTGGKILLLVEGDIQFVASLFEIL